jgi:hypothetical protein
MATGNVVQLGTATDTGPSTQSADYISMRVYMEDVSNILAGHDAIMRAGTRYLPQFAKEDNADYRDRVAYGKFTNIFRDILDNLSSKPFARTVDVVEGSKLKHPGIEEYIENIDGRGNHLHIFAGDVFFNAIGYSVDWIMVDKPPLPAVISVAEAEKSGARPYWERIAQENLLAVYSGIHRGKEVFTHVRVRENTFQRVGFVDQLVEQVRVYERPLISKENYGPAVWTLYRKKVRPGSQFHSTNIVTEYGTAGSLPVNPPTLGSQEWEEVDRGTMAIGIIPLICVATGRRVPGTWRFLPTMKDVAHLQIKHYQAETNLEYAKNLTSSPMLSAKDVMPAMRVVRREFADGTVQITEEAEAIVVGPKTVLYGEWSFVEISAMSLEFLQKSIDKVEKQMREIGRQPLTSDSGNLTTITTAFAAQKGNSAVQAWALGLKDALELAFIYTGMWIGQDYSDVEVAVYTDFAIDLEPEAGPQFVLEMQKRRMISRAAALQEGKRRNFLSAEYNPEADAEQIEAELDDWTFMTMPGVGEPEPKEPETAAPAKKTSQKK